MKFIVVVTPAKAGVHRGKMDSRFRGNDLTFGEARNLALIRGASKPTSRARFLAEFTLSTQSEVLRCAQDDSEGLGMTSADASPQYRL